MKCFNLKKAGSITATIVLTLFAACGGNNSNNNNKPTIGIAPPTVNATVGGSRTFTVTNVDDFTLAVNPASGSGCVKSGSNAVVCTPTATGTYNVTVSDTATTRTSTAVFTVTQSGGGTALTSASVKYLVDGEDELILTFDSNGDRIRWDTFGEGLHSAYILNHITMTYWANLGWMNAGWMELDYFYDFEDLYYLFQVFRLEEMLQKNSEDYRRSGSEELIIGSRTYPCNVITIDDYGTEIEAFIWNDVTLLMKSDGIELYRAVQIYEDAPDGAFTQKLDLTWAWEN